MGQPQRNVELKSRDLDPTRTLARCRSLGAEDRGERHQRDTYFAAARARLKLREQDPGAAELIGYLRSDAPGARQSRYRIATVDHPAALRAVLDGALGTRVVVEKRRRLLLWHGVRIHLDDVAGLGSFVELEGAVSDGSELSRTEALVERLRQELAIADEALVAVGYADLVQDGTEAQALLAAAQGAMRRAHAPYSGFAVGAALRTPDGTVFTGANLENAAFPQGQCAEASALGALVTAGARRVAAVAVVAEHADVCPPCGGCRQMLAELAGPDTLVHLGRPGGPSRTLTLGELLPLAFDAETVRR